MIHILTDEGEKNLGKRNFIEGCVCYDKEILLKGCGPQLNILCMNCLALKQRHTDGYMYTCFLLYQLSFIFQKVPLLHETTEFHWCLGIPPPGALRGSRTAASNFPPVPVHVPGHRAEESTDHPDHQL